MLFRSAVAVSFVRPNAQRARDPFDIKALPHFQKSISYSCILTVFNTIRFYQKNKKIHIKMFKLVSTSRVWRRFRGKYRFGQLDNFQLIWPIDWTCGDKFSLFFAVQLVVSCILAVAAAAPGVIVGHAPIVHAPLAVAHAVHPVAVSSSHTLVPIYDSECENENNFILIWFFLGAFQSNRSVVHSAPVAKYVAPVHVVRTVPAVHAVHAVHAPVVHAVHAPVVHSVHSPVLVH